MDERLFETPSVAISECNKLSNEMALLTKDAVHDSLDNLFINSGETNEAIADLENQVDVYEDRLGSYLVRIAGEKLSQSDSRTMSKILHSIGNFERISDHCSNIAVAVIEVDSDIYDPHEYLKKVRVEEKSVFNSFLEEYDQKYNIKKLQ